MSQTITILQPKHKHPKQQEPVHAADPSNQPPALPVHSHPPAQDVTQNANLNNTHSEAPSTNQQQFPPSFIYKQLQTSQLGRSGSVCPSFLKEMLKENSQELSPTLVQEIRIVQEARESQVYTLHFASRQEYIQQYYLLGSGAKLDAFTGLFLAEMMQGRQQAIVREIEAEQLPVYKRKENLGKQDLAELERMDHMRLIRIREGELKSKLDILNDRIQQVRYYSQVTIKNKEPASNGGTPKIDPQKQRLLEQSLNPKNYAMDSEKTRQASEFVIRKREEKVEREKYIRQQLEREEEQRLRQMQQRQQHKLMLEREKVQQRLKKLQEKHELKEKQKQETERRQMEFMQFLEQFKSKKPLFQKHEEEFREKVVKVEEMEKLAKLREIRQQHKPIGMQSIIEHQKDYLERRAEAMARHEDELRMELQERLRSQKEKKYFQGKFHNDILSQPPHTSVKIIAQKREQREKLKEFANSIQMNFKPAVDEHKQQELQDLIAKTQRRNRKLKRKRRVVHASDTAYVNRSVVSDKVEYQYFYEEINDEEAKKQGNMYLQYSRRLGMKNKRLKQKSKKEGAEEQRTNLSSLPNNNVQDNLTSINEGNSKPVTTTTTPSRSRSNYLEQQRLKRQALENGASLATQQWKRQLHNRSISDAQRLDRIRMHSQLMDQKVRNQEQVMKYQRFASPMDEIKKKSEIDQNYLNSIKAKVALLGMVD